MLAHLDSSQVSAATMKDVNDQLKFKDLDLRLCPDESEVEVVEEFKRARLRHPKG